MCGRDVTHLSAGAQFTVLMTREHDVFGFGCNTSGQLGQTGVGGSVAEPMLLAEHSACCKEAAAEGARREPPLVPHLEAGGSSCYIFAAVAKPEG